MQPLHSCCCRGRRSFATNAAQSDANRRSGGKRISQNEFTEKAWQAIVNAPSLATNAQAQVSIVRGHSFCLLLQCLGRSGLQQTVLPALHCSIAAGTCVRDEMAAKS